VQGGPECASLHPEKTLFLCWPPKEEHEDYQDETDGQTVDVSRDANSGLTDMSREPQTGSPESSPRDQFREQPPGSPDPSSRDQFRGKQPGSPEFATPEKCDVARVKHDCVHTCDRNVHTCDRNVHTCDRNVHTCDRNVHARDRNVHSPSNQKQSNATEKRNLMALSAVEMYQGETIIYVGEWKGRSGAVPTTGSETTGQTAGLCFQRELETRWKCVKRVRLDAWPFVNDELSVWKRLEPVRGSNVCKREPSVNAHQRHLESQTFPNGDVYKRELSANANQLHSNGQTSPNGSVLDREFRNAVLNMHRLVWEEDLALCVASGQNSHVTFSAASGQNSHVTFSAASGQTDVATAPNVVTSSAASGQTDVLNSSIVITSSAASGQTDVLNSSVVITSSAASGQTDVLNSSIVVTSSAASGQIGQTDSHQDQVAASPHLTPNPIGKETDSTCTGLVHFTKEASILSEYLQCLTSAEIQIFDHWRESGGRFVRLREGLARLRKFARDRAICAGDLSGL
jgi:hypothetical protein